MGDTLDYPVDTEREWLEADGLGGFAMGTAGGLRTRRYHGLLNVATRPPSGRVMLLKGYDAWLESPIGRCHLSSQLYAPDNLYPGGARHLERFEATPWPSWTYSFDDGTRVRVELMVPRGHGAVLLSWRLLERGVASKLNVRLFHSGRGMHELLREQDGLHLDVEQRGARLLFRAPDDALAPVAWTNGDYRHEPHWYRNFLYLEERARGYDCEEDLLSTGALTWDLRAGDALLLLGAPPHDNGLLDRTGKLEDTVASLRDLERLRRHAAGSLGHAADSYLVQRGEWKTVIAGYPWFGEYGRDTFVALRGLCLARGRLDEAGEILLNWARALSQGMLPNRYAGPGTVPEYNSVDAALWFVVAVSAHAAALAVAGRQDDEVITRLRQVVEEILDLHIAGTRFGIRLDEDGLLAAGEPGLQLTWMDAKVGTWVVTPRVGKPIEVQCLWLNALAYAQRFEPRYGELYRRGLSALRARFYDDALGYAYDVVDVEHHRGAVDARLRPNQILAVGGLPAVLFEQGPARRIVDTVEARLLTPLGLRTLDPDAGEYEARHEGGVLERDGSYHQGTVWPWLLGPFIEAWLRVRGSTEEARREVRRRFYPAMGAHLEQAGLGHVSELADAEPPHTPRGCPFQAWSVAEWIRIEQLLGARIDEG